MERRRRLGDLSHDRQVNFSRTVWITFHCRGTTSNVSVMSSPSLDSLPPQAGHAQGAGPTTRSRGRCAGNGARTVSCVQSRVRR